MATSSTAQYDENGAEIPGGDSEAPAPANAGDAARGVEPDHKTGQTPAEHPDSAPGGKHDRDSEENDRQETEQQAPEGLSLMQLIGSVFAAGLGVQSSKNRERDFKQGRAGAFILAGLLFTALFIGTVYGIVSLVLSSR